MLKYNEKIEKARKAIADADAILIGAGAGLSEAAGIHNSGPDFQEAFSDYIVYDNLKRGQIIIKKGATVVTAKL